MRRRKGRRWVVWRDGEEEEEEEVVGCLEDCGMDEKKKKGW